jgi:hypothetical protein
MLPDFPTVEAFWDHLGEGLRPSNAAQRFHDFWNRIRPAPDVLPGRQHIRLERVSDLLPNVSMFDILTENGVVRLRRRLVGTALVDAMGHDPTGWVVDDDSHQDPASPSTMTARAKRVVERKVPHWRLAPPLLKVYSEGGVMLVETVLAPLASDGQTPDIILCLARFLDASRRQTKPFKWRSF